MKLENFQSITVENAEKVVELLIQGGTTGLVGKTIGQLLDTLHEDAYSNIDVHIEASDALFMLQYAFIAGLSEVQLRGKRISEISWDYRVKFSTLYELGSYCAGLCTSADDFKPLVIDVKIDREDDEDLTPLAQHFTWVVGGAEDFNALETVVNALLADGYDRVQFTHTK